MNSPLLFLFILFVVTIVIAGSQALSRQVRQQKLMNLAREWKMHYAADDRFGLAPRVAERLALPGSAGVYVVDLIYGTEAGIRRFVFSAHYTIGVVTHKRRASCVASMSEDCRGPIGEWSEMSVAPTDGSILEQYRAMGEKKQTALEAPSAELSS